MLFHLDPLWSSPNIDFVGIDNYLPLSDWRDGTHLDAQIADHIGDPAYLTGNVYGGEYYDWYYASDADRRAQVRTPISDGLLGDHWVFRTKDLKGWWENDHYERLGGRLADVLAGGATPGSWAVSGAAVSAEAGTFLGRYADSQRVASGGSADDRIALSHALAAGAEYEASVYYTPGSAGGLRLSVWDGGVLILDVAGVSGSASVVSAAGVTNVSAQDEAEGDVRRLRVRFTVGAAGTVAFGAGPGSETAGEDVVVHGATLTPSAKSEATPTAWVPEGKPIWFTEVGCPAIDRGANQPNVFYDPKSSESTLPYFSSGRRDDAMQRAYLSAMLGAFDPDTSSDIDGFNPASSRYSGRMIDPGTVHAWTWDARPWPAFPHRTDVWSDGDNWERGHWLTGRIGGAPFDALVEAMFADWGAPAPEVVGGSVVFDGYIVGAPQSLRSAVEPVAAAASMVGADTGTGIRFVDLLRGAVGTRAREDFVELGAEQALLSSTREELAALPVEQRLRYFDSGREFQVASARFRPAEGSARQIEEISVSASLNDGLAQELAEVALAARWSGRTTLRFQLPPSDIAFLPGDILTVRSDGRDRDAIIEEVEDVGHREVVARTINRLALTPTPTTGSRTPPISIIPGSPPVAFGLNLPIVDDSVAEHTAWLGVFARPWPGEMGLWRAVNGGSFVLERTISSPASVGEVVGALPAVRTSLWDFSSVVDVFLYNTAVSSADPAAVLEGANAIAVEAVNGTWEVLQFQNAVLIGERTYRLTGFLRGQLGTEDAANAGISPGAPVAVLDGSLADLGISLDQVGLSRTYRVGPLSEGIGGANVTTFDFTPTGRGITPYSPVHARAVRQADGSVRITFIRRTRIGGDPWPDGTDVPLGESEERYRFEIMAGSTVLRTAEITSEVFIYTLADQTADFGAAPSALSLRISQIAPGFGLGIPLEVTVDVQQS